MATYRITYAKDIENAPPLSEEIEASHMYAADWCVVFCDERDNPVKIIHANAIEAVELKPQTH